MIDTTSELGRRAAERLREDQVIWLTTVGPDGTPEPRPVWFYWTTEELLVFSQPGTYKLQHMARSPMVAVHFNSTSEGGDVVVMTGSAQIDENHPPANEIPGYIEKYQEGIESLGMSAAQFARSYSVPIRITLNDLRGH